MSSRFHESEILIHYEKELLFKVNIAEGKKCSKLGLITCYSDEMPRQLTEWEFSAKTRSSRRSGNLAKKP